MGAITLRAIRKAFPSPCGEKVGINIPKPFSSLLQGKTTFPSPCGEKVGINTDTVHSLVELLKTFPSPCGEKVGINP